MSRSSQSYIANVGVYLPPKKVSTAELIAGCRNVVRIPLERLTGIQTRHVAGEEDFSIDLARKAIEDCLGRSETPPEDFDLLICANISRYDAPRSLTYEPSTSSVLKKEFGLKNAIAMDLSNACAGMWTSVYLVDALIRTGAIKRGLVVSGEYITYLADTAQKEIVDYLDPQVASLTVGDSGVAIELRASPSPNIGFHDLELYTLAQYCRNCIAKPTDQAHGGAAMYTDAVKVTTAVVPHAAKHVEQILSRNGESISQYEHIIPHQTSKLSMQDAVKTVASRFPIDLSQRLINNLSQRGNTATTSHFLALRDAILNEQIQTGDSILFLISGSGQTTGTALYTCDDLPDRLRANRLQTDENTLPVQVGETLAVPLQIESLAQVSLSEVNPQDTLTLLQQVAETCLNQSQYTKEEMELLVSVGVYRTEFLTEPAIAALLAGDMEINDKRDPEDPRKTLAFDLLNGALGFLNACYLISELSRAGCVERALVVASEIENNSEIAPDQLMGLCEMGSAMILHESEDGETGFLAFSFQQFPEHAHALRTFMTWNPQGKSYLERTADEDLYNTHLENIERSASRFLEEQHLEQTDIRFLIPPQISPTFVRAVSQQLGFSTADTIDVSRAGHDLATSSTPVAMQAILNENLAQKGDLGLIINVASGGQVGCALYRF